MDSVMRAAIGGQFGAVINTLREAVENCPEYALGRPERGGAVLADCAPHALLPRHVFVVRR